MEWKSRSTKKKVRPAPTATPAGAGSPGRRVIRLEHGENKPLPGNRVKAPGPLCRSRCHERVAWSDVRHAPVDARTRRPAGFLAGLNSLRAAHDSATGLAGRPEIAPGEPLSTQPERASRCCGQSRRVRARRAAPRSGVTARGSRRPPAEETRCSRSARSGPSGATRPPVSATGGRRPEGKSSRMAADSCSPSVFQRTLDHGLRGDVPGAGGADHQGREGGDVGLGGGFRPGGHGARAGEAQEVEDRAGEGGRRAAAVGGPRNRPQGRHADVVAAAVVAHYPAPPAHLKPTAVLRRPQHHRAGAGHHHDARAGAEGVVERRFHVGADPHRARDLLVAQGRFQGAAHLASAGTGQAGPQRREREVDPGCFGGAAHGVRDHPGRGGGTVGTHQRGGAFRPAAGRAVAGEQQHAGAGPTPVDARDEGAGHGRRGRAVVNARDVRPGHGGGGGAAAAGSPSPPTPIPTGALGAVGVPTNPPPPRGGGQKGTATRMRIRLCRPAVVLPPAPSPRPR